MSQTTSTTKEDDMPKLKTLIRPLLALAMSSALSGTIWAQSDYPNKPLRFITPFPPGASTDLATRFVADKLGEKWGQRVVVENRPGGNTVIGTQMVARAAPDGYTVLVTTNAHTVTPLLMSAPYDPVKDFVPIALITRGEWVLAAHPSVQANNLKEFIALMKANPNGLNYATSGTGGASHLATELLGMMTGTQARHVPYKGGSAVIPDLLAGQVQFTFAVPVAVTQHIKAGKLKGIAVSGGKRLPALPDLPTFTESGLTGFDAGYWIGALVPAGTPTEIVNKMSRDIEAILATQEGQQRMLGLGTQPDASTRERFVQQILDDVKRYSELIRVANIKL
jgi:tripartite-type tricarboxylate transporter receptor subunit TctC